MRFILSFLLALCLLPAAFADTARFYFPEVTAADISPTEDAGWTYDTEFVRRQLASTKGSSTLAFGTTIGALGAGSPSPIGIDRQYISTDLGAGLTFTSGVDTMKCYLIFKEFGATDNIDTTQVVVKIVSNDGSTVRATLKALGNYASNTEFSTTGTNRAVLDGDTVAATYTTVSGDRLVVEIGANASGGGTTPEFATWWGENGTDLPEDQTSTSGNGWFEITYSTGGGPAPVPATLTMMGIGM